VLDDSRSVFELNAGEDLGDEFEAGERAPALLGGVGELAPFVTRVRSFTVAKLDSIGFVVRMWRQCSAGKS
jgi:hypothetical protein